MTAQWTLFLVTVLFLAVDTKKYLVETEDAKDTKKYLVETEDANDSEQQDARKDVYTGRRDNNPTGRRWRWVCFPGSSSVKLASGETKSMRDVKTGDLLMTIVDGRMTETKVLGFLDKNIAAHGKYVNIRTEDGRRVSLSGTHVMFISDKDGNYEDVMAEEVILGDSVIVSEGGEVKKSRVVEILTEVKEGAYTPLTTHGTLLVDGVLCSSYVNGDHATFHLIATPVRWFPSLFLDDNDGKKAIATLGQYIGYYLHKMGLMRYFHSHAMEKEETDDDCQDVQKKIIDSEESCVAPALTVCPALSFWKL